MSKEVSSREFFHSFAKLHAAMKPGETLVITKHGKAIGEFRKQPVRRSFQIPDFRKLGLEPKATVETREAVYRKLMGGLENESLS